MAGKRSRWFDILVYDETIIEKIEMYDKYAWICHDKDVNEETGELKKEHFHIFLEFKNARYINGLADELEIPSNMINVKGSKKGCLLYLTHKNAPEKYQYQDSEIHSNFDISHYTADEATILTVHELVCKSKNFESFLTGVHKNGIKGNPLTMYCHCCTAWEKSRVAPKEEDYEDPLDELERKLRFDDLVDSVNSKLR